MVDPARNRKSLKQDNPVALEAPMSPLTYALVSLIGLAIGVALCVFYVYQVPRLVANGIKDRFFYLLLIPWGFSCSAFLFGAMRSYARYSGRQLSGKLELGGPVVLFCAILLGGFKLVPPEPTVLDITVRAHSTDGREPIIKSGTVTIRLGRDSETRDFDPETGEADFKGLQAGFGNGFDILPEVQGYQSEWTSVKPVDGAVDIPLSRIVYPNVDLEGSIVPVPSNWRDLSVLVDGQEGTAGVDRFGRFDLATKLPSGAKVRVHVFAHQKEIYDDFQRLPGPVQLLIKSH